MKRNLLSLAVSAVVNSELPLLQTPPDYRDWEDGDNWIIIDDPWCPRVPKKPGMEMFVAESAFRELGFALKNRQFQGTVTDVTLHQKIGDKWVPIGLPSSPFTSKKEQRFVEAFCGDTPIMNCKVKSWFDLPEVKV